MAETQRSKFKKLIKICAIVSVFSAILGVTALISLYLYIAPSLPDPKLLTTVELQEPLRVFSADNKLIAEYGDKRREPAAIEEIPEQMKQAVIAAEDDRFYAHPGVDYQGLLRAAYQLVLTGEKSQGGSTITMQVARNFFLTREKTYIRKIREIFLALKMERVLSKDEILALYLNESFLGKRAYGVAAAAQIYYGLSLQDLTLPQYAMIAGLPKAPSRYNPVNNPERALIRRDYVLGRMLTLGFITEEEHQAALETELTAKEYQVNNELKAPYIGEMARAFVHERFSAEKDIYNEGLKVYTTVVSNYQEAANQAVYTGLLNYEERRGFTGVIDNYAAINEVIEELNAQLIESMAAEIAAENSEAEITEESVENSAAEAMVEVDEITANEEALLEEEMTALDILHQTLEDLPAYGPMETAVVVKLEEQAAIIYNQARGLAVLPWEGLAWAAQRITVDRKGPSPETADEILDLGDMIYLRNDKLNSDGQVLLTLTQMPEVEGSLVSLDPQTGGMLAVVGGFDFFKNKFNRAMQAERQPGSSFKPFLYTTALDNGFTPASIINDAPVVFDYPELEGRWKPENYSGRFYGPTRLREGLVKSRNLISIRLLIALGVRDTRNYVRRFGLTNKTMPFDLSLSLGSGSVLPIELATAYAVFANGGYKVDTFFIDRIEDRNGNVIYYSDHSYVCESCDVRHESLFTEEEKAEQALLAEVALELQALEENKIDTIEADSETEEASQAESLLASNEQDENSLDVNEVISEENYEEALIEEMPLVRENYPATQVLAKDTHFLIHSVLNEVTLRGTGVRATRTLKRSDLAGKTGTTNDQNDAWFSGYHEKAVAVVWVGYDDHLPLGNSETGAGTALPIWIDYMKEVLKDEPEYIVDQPENVLTVRIDKDTGKLANELTREALFEFFREGEEPVESSSEEDFAGILDNNELDTQELF